MSFLKYRSLKTCRSSHGKGKGNVDHWVFKVKAGVVLYEIETNSILTSIKALELSQRRLPLKTKIIFN